VHLHRFTAGHQETQNLNTVHEDRFVEGFWGLILEKSLNSDKQHVSYPVPFWGYLCAGLCILIPIVTVGGAIPGAIGFAGAGACMTMARSAKMNRDIKIALCLGVTLLCWGLLALFYYLIH
jgi:hypothetical protein